MTSEEELRSQELRTQLAAVLRANRELGPQYEQVAVDQLVDIIRGDRPAPAGGARRTKASPPPPARLQSTCQTERSRGAPWWLWGAGSAALIYWGPALLRHSGLGALSWIPTVLVLVVFAQVVKVIARWGRRLGGAWEPPGSGSTPPDPLLRSRRWY